MSELVPARSAQTLLFAPGDRPERFDKALASGADLVVLDLEDAVADDAKLLARQHVADTPAHPQLAVRVNAVGTAWHDADLEALAQRPQTVVLPKAQSAAEVLAVVKALPEGSSVVALIETARGVLAAAELASVPGVDRLAFGSFDLAAELGVSPDNRAAMAASRGALVLASAAAGLSGPVDGVTGSIADEVALRDDVKHARDVGFAGKFCIHPRQVAAVAAGFAPSPSELERAQRILDAWHGTRGGAVLVDGRMVDLPVVERAIRTVQAAGRRAARG